MKTTYLETCNNSKLRIFFKFSKFRNLIYSRIIFFSRLGNLKLAQKLVPTNKNSEFVKPKSQDSINLTLSNEPENVLVNTPSYTCSNEDNRED